jgi:hypothetical protein
MIDNPFINTGGIDYGGKRVCFKRALFQAKPGPSQIWESLRWGAGEVAERCSYNNKSSLLMEYNRFSRERWGLLAKQGHTLPETIQITLIIRKGSNMRVFANEMEIMNALRGIPNTTFRAVDFASISFTEQVAIAHNTR